MEAYERLKRLLEEVADDMQKAEGGNKAAGTRVRKVMQDVKSAAQDVRNKILDIGKGQAAPPSAAPRPMAPPPGAPRGPSMPPGPSSQPRKF